MRITVKLPKMSDAGDDAVVVQWLVATGSTVTEGMPLVRVETAKANVDVPAPTAGVLEEQLVQVDDEIATGAPIAMIVN